ncbi:aspartyl-tRNA(Asn)/glutamyl-tRNA(Gln) amidotransferase subunit A [Pseudooceanicola antarcticus]|uniref:Amidase n=1 Tax=Pseudooceanicola antarcticus TaxID=1247613 RepID=A0A285HNR5_9RHOB|nr:amidase [Pseudooceanicola antarcticus]PJE27744.1 amidase [Pseudooceanicola antarcticus]SNY37337.1 aspartyl-tRNA(Asn)/glutamyl-tRNA(Gln) amidotransferase subunit A [Pseudooceanicola antarcticus]
MQDWLWMEAAALGAGIERGEIDPVALAETYLNAIDAHEAGPRIYARTMADRALAEAKAAADRARLGIRLHPLDGVPISWKDLFDTAGVATEAGSALLEGRVPAEDARVLRNASQVGLVCLGKTHMTELAFSGIGLNPVTATPPNVNHPDWVPGGSSSGAASSVAHGLAAGGIGSDTGGSVRIPAAWNDLVGFKTTSGRVSLEGVVPLAKRFDTVGPIGRSVLDCVLMLSALEGRPAPDLTGASLRGMRLATMENHVLDDIRPEPLAAYRRAVEVLRDAGAEVVEVRSPEYDRAALLTKQLIAPEGYGLWKDVIEAAPEKMFPEILERFRGGGQVLASDYVAAWEQLEQARAEWHARMAGYDAVLSPSSAILPPFASRMLSNHDYYVTENLLALRNTRVGNLMGLPAVTLPAGAPSCGIMLMGKPFAEEALARVSAAAEAALRAA